MLYEKDYIMFKGFYFTGLTIILFLFTKQSLTSNLKRISRGLLSRTGLCPNPLRNAQVKDYRLNVFGVARKIVPDVPDIKLCQENECLYDIDCHGDKRCCKNLCGAMVCTEAIRDPHPCTSIRCPAGRVCNLQRVKCIFPDCPDLYAIKRPMCVKQKYREFEERTKPDEVYFTPRQAFYDMSQHE